MRILGIETTCDETGVAVVENGRRILSNVVASSVDLQKKYGGVVPEVAAREQVRSILPVIAEAIENAAQIRSTKSETRNNLSNPKITKWAKENVDAIAVAYGPGLIGSLLIGVETVKALALAWDKPLISVNHLVGHIYSNWLESSSKPAFRLETRSMRAILKPKFPLVALIVSGGHTDLVLMTDHGKFKLLGSTLDDAAGESFDKVAKLLGLGYPGGPEIERSAQQLTTDRKQLSFKFPRPLLNSRDFDFSFSGLKTSVVNYVSQLSDVKDQVPAIAAEFQLAVVDVLVKKTIKASQKFNARSIVVGGGVAANELLRKELRVKSLELKTPVFLPQKNLSVDNGAMIAVAAFHNFKKIDPLKLSADPSLHF